MVIVFSHNLEGFYWVCLARTETCLRPSAADICRNVGFDPALKDVSIHEAPGEYPPGSYWWIATLSNRYEQDLPQQLPLALPSHVDG